MKTIQGKVSCTSEKCQINANATVRVAVWGVDTEDEVKTVASVYPTGITEFPFSFSIDIDENELNSLLINSISINVSIETKGTIDYKSKETYVIAEQLSDGSVRIKDFVDIELSPFKRL